MAALGPNRDEEHCNGPGASAVAQAGSTSIARAWLRPDPAMMCGATSFNPYN